MKFVKDDCDSIYLVMRTFTRMHGDTRTPCTQIWPPYRAHTILLVSLTIAHVYACILARIHQCITYHTLTSPRMRWMPLGLACFVAILASRMEGPTPACRHTDKYICMHVYVFVYMFVKCVAPLSFAGKTLTISRLNSRNTLTLVYMISNTHTS